jgi:hypothetical protein
MPENLEDFAFRLRQRLRDRGVQTDGPASVIGEWTDALRDTFAEED